MLIKICKFEIELARTHFYIAVPLMGQACLTTDGDLTLDRA